AAAAATCGHYPPESQDCDRTHVPAIGPSGRSWSPSMAARPDDGLRHSLRCTPIPPFEPRIRRWEPVGSTAPNAAPRRESPMSSQVKRACSWSAGLTLALAAAVMSCGSGAAKRALGPDPTDDPDADQPSATAGAGGHGTGGKSG